LKHFQIFKFLVFYSLLYFCKLIVSAQTIEETFAYANDQMQYEHYENGMKAYQRVLYFDKKMGVQIYSRLAECHYLLGDYAQATRFYDLAYYNASNDSIKYDALFRKANCLLLQHQYNSALAELFALEDTLDFYWLKKKYFFYALTYFGLEEFENSKLNFEKAFPSEKDEIEQLFKKNGKISRISPKAARILSLILPGLGQIYAGDVKDGLNSFLLTSGFLALAVYTGYTYTIFEAIVSVFPWYQRYYIGGLKNAGLMAERKKEEKRAEIFQQLLDVSLQAK
jgi:tetratricopeptide (TPR) repeat protein